MSLCVAPALLTVTCAADPASFLGDMPAWPVNVSCSYFTNPSPTPDELLASVRGGSEAESPEQDSGTCTPRPLFVNKMPPPPCVPMWSRASEHILQLHGCIGVVLQCEHQWTLDAR